MGRYGINMPLEFQRQVTTTGSAGGTSTVWSKSFSAIGFATPDSSKEIKEGEKEKHFSSYKIRIRWFPSFALSTSMRVISGSRVFHIDGWYDNYEDHKTIVVLAHEVF